MALDFNTEPYFDDYDAKKDFYRILFRPSYAVQARELTQLQTILQNQVSRFGDHVFKNGSQVIPGSVNVDNKVHFIKLEQFTGTTDVTTYIESFKNKIITGETSRVKMRVLDTSGGSAVVDDLSIPTLYCKVEGTAEDTITNRLQPGENIIAYTEDNLVSSNFRLTEDQLTDINAVIKLTGSASETPTTYTGNTSSDVIGYGYSVDVGAGIYYIDGIFVRNDDLKLYVSRFNNTPSCRVGFKVTEETIAPEDDESILDNATGSYNFAAPGAHRYKVSLSLVKLPLTGTDTFKFIELVRIFNGRVQQKVTTSSYAELEKSLARRTYDESGNYEVNKFKLSVREHANNGTNQGVYSLLGSGELPVEGVTYGDDNKFCLVVDPGKAYVHGYEIESTVSQFIDINKAREINGDEGNHIQRTTKQTVGMNYGSYVEVKNLFNYPDIINFEKVYLVSVLQPRPAVVVPTVNPSTGAITGFTIKDGGYGYTNSWSGDSTAVVPRTATGSGAVLSVTVTNGVVTAVSATTAGAGYSATIVPEIRLLSNLGAGNQPSTSNIVGTARVRGIQTFNVDTSVKTSTTYKLSLFDIQMFSGKSFDSDVKSIISTRITGNFFANVNPTQFVIPGTATASTGSNLVNGFGTVFTSSLKVGDIIFLNDKMAGTVAQLVPDLTYPNLGNYQVKLSGNSLVDATSARITVFSSELVMPAYESMLFPVGQTNIKTLRGYVNGSDTFKDTDIVVRRQFPLSNASSNKVSWQLTIDQENFLTDEEPANYILIDASSKLPMAWDSSDSSTNVYISFDSIENRKVVTFNNVPAGNYYLIASVKQVTTAAQESTKTLNKTGVRLVETRKEVNLNTIELLHGDIFKLVSVEMSPDDGSFTFNQDTAIDITDRYTLDNGQRPAYYTTGKINLKPGAPVPNGAIRIKYWYFTYSDIGYGGNYFSVDSYAGSGIEYSEIPSYSTTDASTGKTKSVCLTDVIDFRPVLTTTNTFSPELPLIGSDISCPRANYVGRIDKIVLDSVGKFNVITGVPSTQPKEPEDLKEGMTLATVAVPPYTKSSKDVIVTQRDNRRYTMRDIGNLERRITNLEYYVTLSLLEKDTAQLSVIDPKTGLDRFKNGFIVDQFTGHGIGDVKHQDYRVSIDSVSKILRPMHYTNSVELVEDLSSGADRGNKTYQKTGDLITLPYAEQAYIFNNNATRTMDIHAISMGAFRGQVTLFPEGDNWKSITRRPDLTRVDDNNYDAIKFIAAQAGVTGTKWDEWQTNWAAVSSSTGKPFTKVTGFDPSKPYGSWRENSVYETTVTNYVGWDTRSGVETTLLDNVNAQTYGDRVVDMSYIPFMRSRPITFIAKNLKAKTRFYPFFDSVPVRTHVKPADVFKVTRVSNSLMSFDLNDLQNNILVDDPRRSFDGTVYREIVGETGGRIEPAFGMGDVISNNTHTATNVVSITNLTTSGTTFSLVVQDSSNIKVGNHVMFYNMDYHNTIPLTQYNDYSGGTIPVSSNITTNTATSKQLNLRVFKVVAVNGGSLTLASLDGSAINAFDAYSTDSYSENARGKLYRLKASGVVAHGGVVYSSDTIGPIQQDIHIVNIKNGFAVGETLTGSVTIGSSGTYNGFVVNEINGGTTSVTLKNVNDYLVSDVDGSLVGVFHIPETDALSFRTGERTFKLTDNMTDSKAEFDSFGSAVYYAQGISLDKERTIVSSRAVEFVQSNLYQDSRELGLPVARRTGTSTKLLYQYYDDPLAQTFTVNNPGGTFLTSIDLYFMEAGRRPISVELRPTDNGVPSSSKIVPMSKVTKTPEEIKVSDDSSKATNFKFKSPIYLQDGETYSFVIMTDEPGAQVWVSEMGQKDILTKNTIAGQPLTGSLYASQNAKEWEIHTLLDAKFTLYNAKFNTNVQPTLYLKNTPPEVVSLDNDPFTITKGKTKIRVSARNHGLVAGQTVTISGVAEGVYGANSSSVGIPSTLLNRQHTVLSAGLEKDSFVINLTIAEAGSGNNLLLGTVNDLVTGQYGGNTVNCTRGFAMDLMYLKTSDMIFTDTKIDYYAKTMTIGGSVSADYSPIIANSNYQLPSRMMIPAYENYATQDNVKVAPLQIKAVMSSSNENISPVIDLQKMSVYAIANVINSTSSSAVNVADIDTRVLLTQGDIVVADGRSTGTGTITVISGQATISGTGTKFTSEVFTGNTIYNAVNDTLIGTVSGSPSADEGTNVVTLTSNSSQSYTGEYYIKVTPNLKFENDANGFGKISTNIDTADNLLSSAGIGKVITIAGVASGIDGTYNVRDVQVVDDLSVYAGNTERDICIVTLDAAFSTTATINMITDPDFAISIQDKYVDDTAPYGSTNYANYVTRTLALAEAANVIKVLFDANIPNSTDVKVYYRAWTGNIDTKKLRWIDTNFVADSKDVSSEFFEREVTVTGIPAFNNVQIKIVFKSTNTVKVPQIKSLRLLALT